MTHAGWGAIVATVLFACGDEPVTAGGGGSTSATGGEAGAGAGGEGATGGAATTTGSGGAGGDACADHAIESGMVERTYVAEDMPAALGGPISEGTYHLIAVRIYTGPGGMEGGTGQMMRETQVWSKVDLQTALDYGEGELHLELAYDLGDGSGKLSTTVLCPEPLAVPWSAYTSDHGQLILYAPNIAFAWEYAIER